MWISGNRGLERISTTHPSFFDRNRSGQNRRLSSSLRLSDVYEPLGHRLPVKKSKTTQKVLPFEEGRLSTYPQDRPYRGGFLLQKSRPCSFWCRQITPIVEVRNLRVSGDRRSLQGRVVCPSTLTRLLSHICDPGVPGTISKLSFQNLKERNR